MLAMTLPETPLLDTIRGPADLRSLGFEELEELATEIRHLIVATVTRNGGHLGSNLGIVELTLALHRVFRSPHDAILFDTGHQAYPHKLLTGRRRQFATLRLPDGMSGYPEPGGVRTRLDREQPCLDRALLLPRAGRRLPGRW